MAKFLIIFLILAGAFPAAAQELPEGIINEQAREWIRDNYYVGEFNALSYSQARRKMFAYIVNREDTIECVYSGYRQYHEEGDESTAYPAPINTEHIVPQSLFNSNEPMRSDIFILQPCYENWNSLRSNYPFREIEDDQTETWIYKLQSTSQVPSENIDLYSEYLMNYWEPRESREGDVARAIMYFFTMYPSYDINSVIDTSVLCDWHERDTVDALEMQRNLLTEVYQGNVNPYIAWPHWANQAFGCSVPVPPVVNGLQGLSSEHIRIYPNPGHERFTFELDGVSDFPMMLELIDTRGRAVDTTYVLNSASTTLNIKAASGVYYIILRDRFGQALGYTTLSILE